MNHHFRKLIAALLTSILFASAYAVDWNMNADPVPGYYEYRITGDMGDGGYSIDISASDTLVDDNGDALHLVTTTSWTYQPVSSGLLQPGFANLLSMNVGSFMLFMIPMMLDGLDMEPGERAVMPGMGRITVQNQETHAGITGHALLVEERDSNDEWRPLMYIVFNENIATPLKSVFYDSGEPVSETTLVEFRAY